MDKKDPNELIWVDTNEGEVIAYYGEEYGGLIKCRRPVKIKRCDMTEGMIELSSHMKLIYDTSIAEVDRRKKLKDKEHGTTPPK